MSKMWKWLAIGLALVLAYMYKDKIMGMFKKGDTPTTGDTANLETSDDLIS